MAKMTRERFQRLKKLMKSHHSQTKSHWNYRVVRHHGICGEWWGLHEVHYEDDVPILLTKDATGIVGNDRDDMRMELVSVERTCTAEVLVFDDKTEKFVGKEEPLRAQ